MQAKVTNYIANFMSRKPSINCDGQIMKPELGLAIAGANMDMSRLATSLE